ncbi:MAG: hypothetical protein GX491_14445 [Chloroflexi bacterium]|nr:hypothetical protein [Chloroflexota bacterium]
MKALDRIEFFSVEAAKRLGSSSSVGQPYQLLTAVKPHYFDVSDYR